MVIQAWDIRPGADFVVAMREGDGALGADLGPVLSPEYLRSDFALSEWDAAYGGLDVDALLPGPWAFTDPQL